MNIFALILNVSQDYLAPKTQVADENNCTISKITVTNVVKGA